MMYSKILNPSEVIHNDLKFLISCSPSDSDVDKFIKLLKNQNVKTLVRTSSLTYQEEPFINAGITIHDLEYSDGSFPSNEIIEKWNRIVKQNKNIAVHCVSGLGRAPTLVAISLINCGMDYAIAIDKIRRVRNGAFNTKQIGALKVYNKTKKSGYCVII